MEINTVTKPMMNGWKIEDIEDLMDILGIPYTKNDTRKVMTSLIVQKCMEYGISSLDKAKITGTEEEKQEWLTSVTDGKVSISDKALATDIDSEDVAMEKVAALDYSSLPSQEEINNEIYSDREKIKIAKRMKRVKVSSMNPAKSSLQGEVITAGNSLVTVRKYVPFNRPWHVESVVLEAMKEKTFVVPYIVEDKHGNKVKKYRTEKEFNIIELPNLDEKAFDELKRQQMSRTSEFTETVLH